MEHDATYTVTIQGKDFLLTKSQIEFDSPNYFTACFLGDFQESQTRHLKISRNPDLFLIISDYLCGYEVLPLSDRALPARMSPELALKNLKTDAAFYQLEGLVAQCDALLSEEKVESKPKTQKHYLVLGSQYKHPYLPPSGIERQMEYAMMGSKWRLRVTEEVLSQDPLVRMDQLENYKGFGGFRKVAAVEQFAREMGSTDPRLVGWHLSTWEESIEVWHAELMVVVEV